MYELLDSLHQKILKSRFAEEVTEQEIEALIEAKHRATAVTVAESEEDMKYTYEELQIMLEETEKAFDVMRKFAEVTNEFLMREYIKPLYQKFLVEKASE